MNIKVGAFLGGLLFGIGLAFSGMTQPAKIVGFLDFGGDWDASLLCVMLGALAVYAPVYRWIVRKWERPLWAPTFSLPDRRDIDWRLIAGAAMFGVGWGMSGYCPGPAFTSLGSGQVAPWICGGAMVATMALYRQLEKLKATRVDG